MMTCLNKASRATDAVKCNEECIIGITIQPSRNALHSIKEPTQDEKQVEVQKNNITWNENGEKNFVQAFGVLFLHVMSCFILPVLVL